MLLVLVVRARSTTLLREATCAVAVRWLWSWEDSHDRWIRLVRDVHRGDIVGGFGTPLLKCLTIDNDDVAPDERNSGMNRDGAAQRRIDREGRDVLGTFSVGDIEDHHPGALPGKECAICDHIRAAMETKAELAGEGLTAGKTALLLRRVRLASGLVLPGIPPLPGDLRIGRIFDVDDRQNVTFEPGERAGGVDPSTAVVEIAMGAGLAADPTPEQLGPIRLLDVPDEKAVLGPRGTAA